MHDPWPTLLAILQRAHAVPAIAWPAACTRVVTMRGPDEEPDIELPPEPPEPVPMDETEAAILEHLADAGPASIREAAAALCIPRQRVWRGLQRLQSRGQVCLRSDGWTCSMGAS